MGSFGHVAPPLADRLAKAPVPSAFRRLGARQGSRSDRQQAAGHRQQLVDGGVVEGVHRWSCRHDLPSLEVRRATELGLGPGLWPGLDSSTLMTRVPLSLMRLVGMAVGKGLPKVPLALGWHQRPSWRTRTYGWPGMLSARTVVRPVAPTRPRCQAVSPAAAAGSGISLQDSPSADCHRRWRPGLPPTANMGPGPRRRVRERPRALGRLASSGKLSDVWLQEKPFGEIHDAGCQLEPSRTPPTASRPARGRGSRFRVAGPADVDQ